MGGIKSEFSRIQFENVRVHTSFSSAGRRHIYRPLTQQSPSQQVLESAELECRSEEGPLAATKVFVTALLHRLTFRIFRANSFTPLCCNALMFSLWVLRGQRSRSAEPEKGRKKTKTRARDERCSVVECSTLATKENGHERPNTATSAFSDVFYR